MTVNDLTTTCGFEAAYLPDGEREIGGAYAGDLLSWVMGRAQEDDVFVTIMTNVNVVAVEMCIRDRHLGDPVCFDSVYTRFGDHKIKGRAIDDRVGCAMLLTLLQQELDFDLYAAFTVQEEVGLRGAAAAAFTIQPDIAIVLETTTASDLAGVEPLKQVCRLGEGPAVPFMDRATLYNRELYELALSLIHILICKRSTQKCGTGSNLSPAKRWTRS